LKIVHGSCPGRHAPPQSLWIGVVTRLHSLQGSDICLRHFPGGIVSSRHHGRLELAKNVFDIYTIIFLVLAVFIFLRLRSVLGQRTGRKRPPYDTHSPRDAVRGVTNDNVVRLPGRSADATATPVEPVDPAERWKGIAEPGSSLASGLDAIAREDKSFNAKHFVSGARTAYEMIVLAYAQGDRPTLRNLLSREVYEGFEAAIRERESKGETVESRFVAIEKSDITGAELRNRTAQITTHFRYAGQGGQCDRRQSGKGNRCYRRVDLRPRPVLARSQLEAPGDRSRSIIGGAFFKALHARIGAASRVAWPNPATPPIPRIALTCSPISLQS
jgi:predicted lipid-binding transport protein (Tim44 family)